MIEKNEFNYVPKVDLFMERSGYKMDIFDILNETITPFSKSTSSLVKNSIQPTEILYYNPFDINGKN